MSSSANSLRDVTIAYATCKVVAALAVYLGAYIGERDLSERFVRLVYLQKKPAPATGSMVATIVLAYLLVVGACLCAVLFTIFVRRGSRADMSAVGTWVTIDLMVFALLATTIGQAVAGNVSNQVYFNYKLEGLRAIRALRRMLARALVPIAAIPITAVVVRMSQVAFITTTTMTR